MLKKKYLAIIIIFLMSPALVPVFYFFFGPETRVCGVDKKTYPSQKELEIAGVAMSYDFPCQFPKKETGLYERKEEIEIIGQLLEFKKLGSLTYLIIKDNQENKEWLLVSDFQDEKLLMPGDQLRINGELNKNTKIVDAYKITNLSFPEESFNVINCVFRNTNLVEKTIECSSEEGNELYSYDDSLRIVAGTINPAQIGDLKRNDILRIRVNTKKDQLQTVIVAQRGGANFLASSLFVDKLEIVTNAYTARRPYFEFLNRETNENEIMFLTANTRMVLKYFGVASVNRFKEGDEVFVVAKEKNKEMYLYLLKNNSVWK